MLGLVLRRGHLRSLVPPSEEAAARLEEFFLQKRAKDFEMQCVGWRALLDAERAAHLHKLHAVLVAQVHVRLGRVQIRRDGIRAEARDVALEQRDDVDGGMPVVMLRDVTD